MPPAKKGDPLPQDQIDLIKKWIEQGADFGTWKGAEAKAEAKDESKSDKKAGDEQKKSEDKPKGDSKGKDAGKGGLSMLESGLPMLSEDVLAAVRARFSVEPAAADSALLRVTAFGRESSVDDAAIAALSNASSHIAELVLARTHATDAAALRFLIESLNDDGYLEDPWEELARSLNPGDEEQLQDLVHHFTVALGLLHSLEPVGVGARDLGECLRLQVKALLAQAEDDGEHERAELLQVALGICSKPMDLLARRDIKRLVQMGVAAERINQAWMLMPDESTAYLAGLREERFAAHLKAQSIE
jgi:RNA polymerase sigma-54 factor